jgi:hypothetical protein
MPYIFFKEEDMDQLPRKLKGFINTQHLIRIAFLPLGTTPNILPKCRCYMLVN